MRSSGARSTCMHPACVCAGNASLFGSDEYLFYRVFLQEAGNPCGRWKIVSCLDGTPCILDYACAHRYMHDLMSVFCLNMHASHSISISISGHSAEPGGGSLITLITLIRSLLASPLRTWSRAWSLSHTSGCRTNG